MSARKRFPRYTPEAALRGAEETIRALELQADAEIAVQRLKYFLKLGWDVMQPGVPFQDSWHIGCLCEHLEALSQRQIRRLIINIPPRMLKSTIISVAFPAWRWLLAPEEKFLAASYGLTLAKRDSRRCRNLIASQWYQARWGNKFKFADDQNEKGRFDNDKGGFRIIASVEGGVLGEGGSVCLYDDPNDLARMQSEPETYPQSVRDWYSGTVSSRYIDPRTDVRLCIQQRASFGGDLTEYLMELGGWDRLVIPNEWTGKTIIGPLAYPDPRTKLGELLFPDRLGPEETAVLKREQRQHYAGQYNQEPTIGGKSGLKREWFRFYNPEGMAVKNEKGDVVPVRIALSDGSHVERIPVELPPAFEQVVHSWDMAFKGNSDNDFVAGHVWARVGANTYLIHRDHGHRTFPETLAVVREMGKQFPAPEKLVEDKANGPAVIDTLKNEVPGLIPVTPQGGKWSRVASISGYVEAGNVHLPNPDVFPWVWDLLQEFAAGESAKHDDDTDAMSQALKRLYDANARQGAPEFRVAPRMNEPASACHVMRPVEAVTVSGRRFVAAIPGRAALWMAELASGSLRVLAELSLEKMDAAAAGREIGRRVLQDLQRNRKVVEMSRNSYPYDILLPKEAFTAVEQIGSWAEMMEHGILSFEPEEGGWEGRNAAREMLRGARIRTEMVEEEDAAVDRLRSLLAFAPPDFKPEHYNREKAFALSEENLGEYHRYMGMVEGKVVGEWPKLKISPACKALIAELGAFRADQDAPPFVGALLLGVCAPPVNAAKREVREVMYSQQPGVRSWTPRRFSMGRR